MTVTVTSLDPWEKGSPGHEIFMGTSGVNTRVTTEIMVVTPEKAKDWLDNNNSHNREIRQSRVDQYTMDMLAERWVFNGESIQFDSNDVLLNGQHRLLAVVQACTPQRFLVVRGLEPVAQFTMDQGTRRSPSEQIQLAGFQVDNTGAAAVRVYLRWQQGKLFDDHNRSMLTTSEVLEYIQDNPSLPGRLADFSTAGYKRIPTYPRLVFAVALKLQEVDAGDAGDFLGSLLSGVGLVENSPILALRGRLERIRATRIPERDIIAYFVMAWNAYRSSRPLVKLVRPSGAVWRAENFPVPV